MEVAIENTYLKWQETQFHIFIYILCLLDTYISMILHFAEQWICIFVCGLQAPTKPINLILLSFLPGCPLFCVLVGIHGITKLYGPWEIYQTYGRGPLIYSYCISIVYLYSLCVSFNFLFIALIYTILYFKQKPLLSKTSIYFGVFLYN